MALNVCPEREHFSLIRPCGMSSETLTSLDALGARSSVERLAPVLGQHLTELLEVSGRGPIKVRPDRASELSR